MAKQKTVLSAGHWIPETCTRADLAVLLGLTKQAVDKLAQSGILESAGVHGLYLTKKSVHNYAERLRMTASGRTEETRNPLTQERMQTEKITRQIKEIELAKMRGEILTLDEVAESWSNLAAAMKSAMLALPGKARTNIPHLTPHDGETLKKLVKDILNDLADEVEASVIGGNAEDIKP